MFANTAARFAPVCDYISSSEILSQLLASDSYLGHLNNVKEHCEWSSVMLKVHRDRNVGLMIGRGPCVGRKTQLAVVCLRYVSMSDYLYH